MWRTLPRSGVPTKGVLRLLLARRAGTHLPLDVGIEHGEVRRLPGADRPAVTVGHPGDRRRLPRQGGDDVGERHVEMGERDAERRLEPEHPGRRLVERLLLGLAGVRCVVGGDGVDRAVGEPRPDGVDVGTACAAAG